MEHVREAFVRDVMHPLRCCLALQRVGEVVQGLRNLQQEFLAYGLPFEGVAAVISCGLPLDPLSNL